MLQPGTHAVRVVNCGYTPPRDGRHPQLVVTFEDDGGESINWYSTLGFTKEGFSIAAFDFAARQLAGLGVTIDIDTDFPALGQPDVSPLFNREGQIVVVNEPYDGKDRIKVKFINDPNRPRGGGERMEPDAAATFAAQLRAALVTAGRGPKGSAHPGAARKPTRKPVAAPAPPLSDPLDDDSIPF